MTAATVVIILKMASPHMAPAVMLQVQEESVSLQSSKLASGGGGEGSVVKFCLRLVRRVALSDRYKQQFLCRNVSSGC